MEGQLKRVPNLDASFLERLTSLVSLRFISEGVGDLEETYGPEDVFAYIYAILHSPTYRTKYVEQLRFDFPRIPYPSSLSLFRSLVVLGHSLMEAHLLEGDEVSEFPIDYQGPEDPIIEKVGWSDGVVWLDAGKVNPRDGYLAIKPGTIGFHGIPEDVWRFRIGSYQVCYKWLKDRIGRTLTLEDREHYRKIVSSLAHTIQVMRKIDTVVESFGGWPAAFES